MAASFPHRSNQTLLSRILDVFRATKSAHRSMTVPFPKSSDIRRHPAAEAAGEIVAFYTSNSFYEQEAERMMASAVRLGLPVTATAVSSAGSWVRNAAMKPSFLLNERSAKRGPLLYVDVDAVFHRNPWPALAAYDCDLAVHYADDGELISATILINDTAAARRLIEMWKERCDKDPDIWDQVVLQQIIAEDQSSYAPQFHIHSLPVGFCWIFDRLTNEKTDVVYIEQLQASRQATQKKRLFGRIGKRLKRRRERIRQIEQILAEG